MSVLLPSERKTFRGRAILAVIYGLLVAGGLTMALPFMVMLSSSAASPFDAARHEPILRALWNRNDRFMRSVATYFTGFPREVFPDAPAHWTTWTSVARDKVGIDRFCATHLAPHVDSDAAPTKPGFAGSSGNPDAARVRRLEELRRRAVACREAILAADIHRTTCRYDARDVAPFLESHTSLEAVNRDWKLSCRSLFDVSFLPESHLPVTRPDWTPPAGEPKYDAWCAFKDTYRTRMRARGDYLCRTLPVKIDPAALRAALIVQFVDHGRRDFIASVFANYRLVGQYLFVRGRAFFNTVVLVILSVLAALIVNPLAAYALSRFKLRGTEKVLLFLLATTAFPAAVTAIPGFLLIRDLGLLNTFAALVLPTVASGMSVFILKGFFDALPRELYEAAAIDGAGEWTVFTKITLPMTTPILAVNALNHFIAAYNSWEWAFLVCQSEEKWTVAVWMYQMSRQFAGQPWCVMAGFVLVSIPTALVFIFCQKVILRGIVLPSMK